MKILSSNHHVTNLSVIFLIFFASSIQAKSMPPNDTQRMKSIKSSTNKNFRSRDIVALVPTKTSIGLRRASNINNIFKGCSSSPSAPYPSLGKHMYSYHDNQNDGRTFLLSTRGGDGTVNDDKNGGKKLLDGKKIGTGITMSLLITLMVLNRDAIRAFNFKEELAKQLDVLSSMGNKGLVTYIFAFMIWELVVGVTTPVETAAGMAFGFKKGILANAIGKTSGAILAFLLGRFVLKDYVTRKLEGNEYMDLVQDSITKTPIRVALIWRFSFLPEQIKNFGLAILPVKTWQFISAVLFHGFPFTLLWTFMGNELGLVVKGVVDKPSKILKFLIAGVYVFGFFISPSLVGLWVKGLRDEKMKRDGTDKKKKQ